MSVLTLADIADLRAYERERDEFRADVIELKRLRRVAIGPIVTVVFENRTTIKFQIQEMARAERMSTDEQIQAELDVYNPLIPGPGELSMTLFIELTSDAELRRWLPKLVGIERAVCLEIPSRGSDGAGEITGTVRIPAAVDTAHEAQLTRDTVTASVHYVRIEVPLELRDQFGTGTAAIGIDHPEYRHATALGAETRASLVADWAHEQERG
jgi:hypothetical protein